MAKLLPQGHKIQANKNTDNQSLAIGIYALFIIFYRTIVQRKIYKQTDKFISASSGL